MGTEEPSRVLFPYGTNTMLNIIKNLLFPNTVNEDILSEAWKAGSDFAIRQHQAEVIRGRDINYQVQLARLLGKRVVILPNEWQDPTFATVIGPYGSDSKDVELQEFFSKIPLKFPYPYKSLYLADRKMVEAILKLDPMERWNLSAGKVYNSNLWKPQGKGDHYTPSDILLKKLEDNNFFQE